MQEMQAMQKNESNASNSSNASNASYTLPRGGMYWKIRPLRQYAPRGPRYQAISREKGCFAEGRIFQLILTRGNVLPFFRAEVY